MSVSFSQTLLPMVRKYLKKIIYFLPYEFINLGLLTMIDSMLRPVVGRKGKKYYQP